MLVQLNRMVKSLFKFVLLVVMLLQPFLELQEIFFEAVVRTDNVPLALCEKFGLVVIHSKLFHQEGDNKG